MATVVNKFVSLLVLEHKILQRGITCCGLQHLKRTYCFGLEQSCYDIAIEHPNLLHLGANICMHTCQLITPIDTQLIVQNDTVILRHHVNEMIECTIHALVDSIDQLTIPITN